MKKRNAFHVGVPHMATIQQIHYITRMKEIILKEHSASQLTTLVKLISEYLSDENLEQFLEDLEIHIQLGDDAHSKGKPVNPKELIKTLYLEWTEFFPGDTYDEFLFKLPNIISRHLHTTPDEPTDADNSAYALTVCSLIFAFNRYHNDMNVTDIHQNRFTSSINELSSLIIKNQTDSFKIGFEADAFNVAGLGFVPNDPYSQERDGFEDVPEELLAQQESTFIKQISEGAGLSTIFSAISNLSQISPLSDPDVKPLSVATFINKMNGLYYMPYSIGRKFTSISGGVAVEFDFFWICGMTFIYAFTDQYGLVKSGLYFDSSDNTFKYLFRRDAYVDNGVEVSAKEYVVSIYTMTTDELTARTRYKFVIQHSKENKQISIMRLQGTSNIITVTIDVDSYVTDLLYPLFNLGLIMSGDDDKYHIVSTKKVTMYDSLTYPNAYLNIFGLL